MRDIERVHLVFKTHLDIGFTDLAGNVLSRYFSSFIPKALDLAAALRRRGGPERFVWTTGSFLIYAYLEQATPAARKRMEAAIAAGDIVWHALPFTSHTELFDPGLFRFAIGLSTALDRRFGRRTIAAKLTDVPGHTRSMIPYLAEAGVEFLHIGVNPASTPPRVPAAFRWQHPAGASLNVMYDLNYGAISTVAGCRDALAIMFTGDNHGPQSEEAVVQSFAEIRNKFPDAHVQASTLDAFAARLRGAGASLPVVDRELGDTWIHGAGTDPSKLAQFRELCRLRTRWVARKVPEAKLERFSRSLMMTAEHTWGMNKNTNLRDNVHYTKEQFNAVRGQANFRRMERSWREQRAYISEAVSRLPAALRTEARTALAALRPSPSARRLTPAGKGSRFEGAHFSLRLDAQTGAIASLVDRSGREWAGGQRRIGRLTYEVFGGRDYDRYLDQYLTSRPDWALEDFSQPGLGAAIKAGRAWHPRLVRVRERRRADDLCILVDYDFPVEACRRFGAPQGVWLRVELPAGRPEVRLTVGWRKKDASRVPEALWFAFNPRVDAPRAWTMDKLGFAVSPLDVALNGNRKLHAVNSGVRNGAFEIVSLDAALVAPGKPSLLDFNNKQPPLARGMHFNLHNSVWGTNFPLWYDSPGQFRFMLRTVREPASAREG